MDKSISLRQYLVLLFVALLSPLVKLIPSGLVARAGTGAWLSTLALLLPVLAVVWLVAYLGRGLPENEGLGELLCRCLGQRTGRILCGVFGLWLLLLSCLTLRLGVERLTSTIYPNTEMGLFFLTVLTVEWWLGRQKLPVLARVGQIFFFAVVLTLALVLVMGVGRIHLYNVWPVWTQDLPGVVRATVPALGVLGTGVGTLFCFGLVTDRRGGRRQALGWTTALCLTLAALSFVVLGVFGPAIVQRLQIPFFSLAKEVSVEGAVERLEPLVVAMWVFTDVVLLGLLLRSAGRALTLAMGGEEQQSLTPLLLVVLPGSYLVAGSFFALERSYETWFLWGDLALFYGVPLAAAVVGKCRSAL
ncbi:MAG: GerAB/ArcD/ProY family transporter [Clostridiales bacterium]|nr:GerAB/ArcD/ProY family transporter [Clostridiales bacterium]